MKSLCLVRMCFLKHQHEVYLHTQLSIPQVMLKPGSNDEQNQCDEALIGNPELQTSDILSSYILIPWSTFFHACSLYSIAGTQENK